LGDLTKNLSLLLQKKLGRPSKLAAAIGEPEGSTYERDTADIPDRNQTLLRSARQASIVRAFQLILEDFSIAVTTKTRTKLVAELPPADELPTYHQFKYWYKNSETRQSQIARMDQSDTTYPDVQSSVIQLKWLFWSRLTVFKLTLPLGMLIS